MKWFFDEPTSEEIELFVDLLWAPVPGRTKSTLVFVTDRMTIWTGTMRSLLVDQLARKHPTSGFQLRGDNLRIRDGSQIILAYTPDSSLQSLHRLDGYEPSAVWVWGDYGHRNGQLFEIFETLRRLGARSG